ncbi:MAG: protoporphyrinogen oxidase HemJ [Pseudomonadota bacterium]
MQELLSNNYEWLRALHIIAIISWMAGMLYLPRLFVYHAESKPNSDKSKTFKIMEQRLLKIIMNPAMALSWIFGLGMIYANPDIFSNGWMHVKFTCVVLMSAVHGVLAKNVRLFAADQNIRSPKYFRILNEIPTLLMIVIVIMAVVQPF